MGKKLYIPNDDDLSLVQMIVGNDYLYRYVITKVVEKVLNTDNYIKKIDESISDIPEIANAICVVYPERMQYYSYDKYDVNLFLRLINNSKNNKIYDLDFLSMANKSVLDNQIIIEKAINILANELSSNPEYRFEYENNDLLDAIFEVKDEKFRALPKELKDKLIIIDPIYFFKFVENYYQCWLQKEIQTFKLMSAINIYSSRYGISSDVGREYRNRNILEEPTDDVKKLVKYMRK